VVARSIDTSNTGSIGTCTSGCLLAHHTKLPYTIRPLGSITKPVGIYMTNITYCPTSNITYRPSMVMRDGEITYRYYPGTHGKLCTPSDMG
jgi:hypothetical protein